MRSVLLPKDYVRYRLTGDRATDVADASGTLLFDVTNRRWSAEVAAALDLDLSLLPQSYESPAVTGRISADGAAATGLREGTPVIAGGGDQAAGAVGMGIVSRDSSAPPSAPRVSSSPQPTGPRSTKGRLHTFCHAVPGRWHMMGVTLAAGQSLAGSAIASAPVRTMGRDSYERLTEEAAGVPAGAEGALWAPYLMGERTPHLDPEARAALVGLTASHTRGHIVRAILEGVAFSLQDRFASSPTSACRSRVFGWAAAARARRSGGRFRPTSTATTSTSSRRKKAPLWARRFWPGSERGLPVGRGRLSHHRQGRLVRESVAGRNRPDAGAVRSGPAHLSRARNHFRRST